MQHLYFLLAPCYNCEINKDTEKESSKFQKMQVTLPSEYPHVFMQEALTSAFQSVFYFDEESFCHNR